MTDTMAHDLLYTDIEDDLRSSLRALLDARCTGESKSAMFDGDRSIVAPLWKALTVELGLAGLLVPEERGGLGASAREVAVVLEELGRAAAPVPFLTSAVIATSLLLFTGEDELLASLSSGERTAALVVPWSTGPGDDLPALTVGPDGHLSGSVTSVAGALEADLLLVLAHDGVGTLDLHVIEANAAQLRPVVSLDMTRQLADVSVDAVAARRVLVGAEPAVQASLEVGSALLASEQLGIAQWCLMTTVDYLKDRRQFGRVVGGFQALKHRLADLYTEVEGAAAAARNAAASVAVDAPDVAIAASVAQAYCSDVAVHAAEEAVQLHGGLGMTWEHPLHVYLKRAKSDQIALGTPGASRARLARLVELTV